MCWSADASDILIQRLKAVHMSVTDGSWNRADMELVPPDTVQMTSEVEEDMANQESWGTLALAQSPYVSVWSIIESAQLRWVCRL